MKSVLITILLFAAIVLAIRFHVFEIMSGRTAYIISAFILIAVFLIALKILGNPLKGKDNTHEKS